MESLLNDGTSATSRRTSPDHRRLTDVYNRRHAPPHASSRVSARYKQLPFQCCTPFRHCLYHGGECNTHGNASVVRSSPMGSTTREVTNVTDVTTMSAICNAHGPLQSRRARDDRNVLTKSLQSTTSFLDDFTHPYVIPRVIPRLLNSPRLCQDFSLCKVSLSFTARLGA